jgi:lipopolysaccharide transport system ATP-binding protein
MRPIIHVEGLGKQYRVGAQRKPYRTIRESVGDVIRSPWRHLRSGRNEERLWVLKDISFDVNPGEVVGIIGRNGAGKSTLLKIISRITEPTRGCVELYGRVGSLLEVGTGFHPELTGRENIYLNGAILGMKKAEIKRRFDEIVAFAEIETFLDTPVKRYSSGMYMRLAFSVAAHLEPEILLVDEVLAVGDAAFQNKCLGKMGEVARGGRTVLFVSHNMNAIRRLCGRAILLNSGSVVCDAQPPMQAVAAYGDLVPSQGGVWRRPARDQKKGGPIVFSAVSITLSGEQPYHQLHIEAELHSAAPHAGAFVAFDVHDGVGAPVFQALPTQEPVIQFSSEPLLVKVTIDLPPLVPGSYRVQAWIGPHYTETYDEVTAGPSFVIESSPTLTRTFPHSPEHGCIVPVSNISIGGAAQKEAATVLADDFMANEQCTR